MGGHQVGQRTIAGKGRAHQGTDHLVSLSERHAAGHQVLGKIDGRHVGRSGRFRHPVSPEGQ